MRFGQPETTLRSDSVRPVSGVLFSALQAVPHNALYASCLQLILSYCLKPSAIQNSLGFSANLPLKCDSPCSPALRHPSPASLAGRQPETHPSAVHKSFSQSLVWFQRKISISQCDEKSDCAVCAPDRCGIALSGAPDSGRFQGLPFAEKKLCRPKCVPAYKNMLPFKGAEKETATLVREHDAKPMKKPSVSGGRICAVRRCRPCPGGSKRCLTARPGADPARPSVIRISHKIRQSLQTGLRHPSPASLAGGSPKQVLRPG